MALESLTNKKTTLSLRDVDQEATAGQFYWRVEEKCPFPPFLATFPPIKDFEKMKKEIIVNYVIFCKPLFYTIAFVVSK